MSNFKVMRKMIDVYKRQYQVLPNIQAYCEANAVEYKLIQIESLSQAKALPCVFNNFAVFYKGKFETVNLLDNKALERILKK